MSSPNAARANLLAAKPSVAIFFGGVALIVVFALRDTLVYAGSHLPQLLPNGPDGKQVPMTTVVQFVMLAFGAFILFAGNLKAYDISKSSVFGAGWSLARDIEILIATIPVVLSGRGAY